MVGMNNLNTAHSYGPYGWLSSSSIGLVLAGQVLLWDEMAL
jgi:hypothetical protein